MQENGQARARERVGVGVSGPLPDTRTRWRRRRILITGDFGRPACTLSPTPSRNLTGEGPDAGMPSAALAVGVYRQSLIVGEGIQAAAAAANCWHEARSTTICSNLAFATRSSPWDSARASRSRTSRAPPWSRVALAGPAPSRRIVWTA